VSSRRGSREIEHLGSAHDGAELEALKAAARQRMDRSTDRLVNQEIREDRVAPATSHTSYPSSEASHDAYARLALEFARDYRAAIIPDCALK
jgi:hypothetical protein